METAAHTTDSSNRTTEQAPKGLSLPELESKEISIDCVEHGSVKAEIFRIFGQWNTPKCQFCVAEEAERREQQARERREREVQARKRADLEFRLKRSCIPKRFEDRHFEAYRPTTPKAAQILEICRNYAEEFPRFSEAGTGMILCGHAGTGKTHLACAIANYIIHRHERSAVYMQVSEAIRMVKETYTKGSERTEQQAVNWFKKPDLLILDELGVQFGTDAERYILFEIINGRYQELKPALMISNLAIKGLTEYVGERTIDRMRENDGQLLVFDWESHRGGKANKSY